MEDTLGEQAECISVLSTCLNPCSNGRYYRRMRLWITLNLQSLNPCSNGRYSRRSDVVLECVEGGGLNPCSNGRFSRSPCVIMYALFTLRPNPCSNGRYSRRSTGREMTVRRVLS